INRRMKCCLYLFVFLVAGLQSLGQLTPAFIALDKTKSFKDAEFHKPLSQYLQKLELQAADSFKYEFLIGNRKYLQIDSLHFVKGKAFFVSDLLYQIVLEPGKSDTIHFNKLLSYLSNKFGKPKALSLSKKSFF